MNTTSRIQKIQSSSGGVVVGVDIAESVFQLCERRFQKPSATLGARSPTLVGVLQRLALRGDTGLLQELTILVKTVAGTVGTAAEPTKAAGFQCAQLTIDARL